MCAQNNFLGFDSAELLKAHVVERNEKILKNSVVAVVKDFDERTEKGRFYLLARKNMGEILYLILPDSKKLCVAKVRSERKDRPYLFEVIA